MAHEYYLRVGKVTQGDAADGHEEEVQPDAIQVGRFLHLYVTGYLPPGVVQVHAKYRQVGATKEQDLGPATGSPDGYKFTVTHYTLQPRSSYLIRVADIFSEPRCLVSQVLDTVE